MAGEYVLLSYLRYCTTSLCSAVHYSSGVGIHTFPQQGQLLAANLQDQGTYQHQREGVGSEGGREESGRIVNELLFLYVS